MKAVHFGAGNIGRGFIGEILYHNQFSITFVDVNQTIINELKTRGSYEIGLADESQERIKIDGVTGLNNQEEPQAVIEQIVEADLITTAIGPNILPFIAELVADGINEREKRGIVRPLDVIACENMIDGSSFFKSEIEKYVINKDYLEQFIGFPDAAVDRIVPEQHHEDPLFVEVEPFSEWVINKEQVKNKAIELEGVLYVENLQPYIERKLFSVNTGHATVAYTGALLGYQTIDEAMKDALVLAQLKSVLSETGELLIRKWGFNREEHNLYIEKIITRFKNPYISDGISRVARTPIRKLGYDERFIRPIREANELGIEVNHLIAMVGMIFNYYDEQDTESHKLADKLAKENLNQVIKEVTGIKDNVLIERIIENINRYAKLAA
ncbi:mannitol-1-phosphate 5-dehydrogenase [Vagococcus fluvialis]|uniref:mannitol-1-phosphate 5-dehydrogenase n=1 Tax=Vagococcus fluvialis TaxID=2738 RepID=UPI003D0E9281